METRHRNQTSLVRALLIGGGAALVLGLLLILGAWLYLRLSTRETK